MSGMRKEGLSDCVSSSTPERGRTESCAVFSRTPGDRWDYHPLRDRGTEGLFQDT